MMNLQETRRRLTRQIDRLVSNLRCRLGKHNWRTPTEKVHGEPHTQYGKRKCTNCGRAEYLTIGKNGDTTWHCTDDILASFNKTFKDY